MRKLLAGAISICMSAASLACMATHAEEPDFNGIYQFMCVNSLMTLAPGSETNGADVVQSGTESPASWFVEKDSDGYYSIRLYSNPLYFLAVSNDNVVMQEGTAATPSMQWSITRTNAVVQDYRISPRMQSNKMISVENGSFDENARIVLGNMSVSPTGRWALSDVTAAKNQPIQDGVYTLHNTGLSKVVQSSWQNTSGTKPSLTTAGDSIMDQYWTIRYKENGYYSVVPYMTPKFSMTYVESSGEIQQLENAGGDNQLWKVLDKGDGTYNLAPKCDISKALKPISENAYVGCGYNLPGENNLWSFQSTNIDLDPFQNLTPENYESFFNENYTNSCIYVNLGSASPDTVEIYGGEVGLSDYRSFWQLERTDDGYYYIHHRSYIYWYLAYNPTTGKLHITDNGPDEYSTWRIMSTPSSKYIISPKFNEGKALFLNGRNYTEVTLADICYDNWNRISWSVAIYGS